ncbi:MAG: helix-hairpin-helix domain-containing protein [Clostridia bacterium]|nr:helix-hairpin-helix domain-containing protein [Clostridia bacterium]
MSLLLAGALLYAFISYANSFPQTKASLHIADAALRPTPAPPENLDELINLNTATFDQLDSLPGIGKKTANAILAMRAELGGFRYREELLLIHGLGEKKLDAIYDLIYVK